MAKANPAILIVLFYNLTWEAFAQPFTKMDSLRGTYGPLRTCYDLTHYHLKLKVDISTRFISGYNRLSGTALEPMSRLQVDLSENYEIDKMITPQGEAKWARIGSAMIVTLPTTLEKGEKFWLQVHYRGHPHAAENAPWDGGFVWQKDSTGLPWVGVACEGEGSSLWFPSKDHPNDEPDSAFLQFEVPKNLMAVSNGKFFGKESVTDSTSRYSYRVSYPINHYNITLNVAAYQHWKDTMKLPDGNVLDMHFYSLPEKVKQARVQYAQSKQVLRVLGQLFGNYAFVRDGYTLVHTPYLGMEHQSCIAYGSRFKNNEFGFDFIVMHETGHEWWGNLISGSDHADMWIHESFCTYSEALYLEKIKDKEVAIDYMLTQKKKIKNKSPLLGARDVYYNGWKDSDMYYKGSWMLHSIRSMIQDDDRWFALLRDMPREIGFKPISSKEIIALISKKVGRDMDPIFNAYLLNEKWPALEWKISKKENESVLEYRWDVSNAEQKLGVELLLDGKNLRLVPDLEWKQIPVQTEKVKLEPNERLNLISVRKIN